MKPYIIQPLTKITAHIDIPPDKSISHRALMLSSLCQSRTTIDPFLRSDDTLITMECLRKLGVTISENKSGAIEVNASGMYFPADKLTKIFAGQSGTTMRILSGLLCGQKFPIEFIAHELLSQRPMARIITPLRQMGADISGIESTIRGRKDIYPPLIIKPVEKLIGKEFILPVASAQIKSALLLAGLYASGQTTVIEPVKSRDHSERMLRLFKAPVEINNLAVTVNPVKELISPGNIFIPGDFSSAAFFIVLALILQQSKIILKKVNINPTRSGLLEVLKRMNADITIENYQDNYEPCADIIVKSSSLQAVTVEANEAPLMIDEIPILCVAAAFAKGCTRIKGVKELKVKETDRIDSMVTNLTAAGVNIKAKPNGDDCQIVVEADKSSINQYRAGQEFNSFNDHRTAMSMIVFCSALPKQSQINDRECINKSFPGFIHTRELLNKKI